MRDQPQGRQSTSNNDRAVNVEERELQQHLYNVE